MERQNDQMTSKEDVFTDEEKIIIHSAIIQSSALAIVNSEGNIQRANHAFHSMFNPASTGDDLWHIDKIIDEYAAQDFFNLVRDVISMEHCWSGQIRLRNNLHQSFHAFLHISKAPEKGLYVVQVNPVDHVNEYERLRLMAYTDELTGVPNFRCFHERMKQLLEGRDAALHFGVLFIDIDHFKALNDRYGHVVGDKLLKACVYKLMKNIYPDGEVFRKSGDEFLIIVQQPAQIEGLIERLYAAFMQQVYVDGEGIPMQVSIGASLYPIDGQDTESLIHTADAAMYQAKRQKEMPSP